MSRHAQAEDLPLLKRADALSPPWRRGMNPEQVAVVDHIDGPARVLAAAGSGKTRCVTHRVARLIQEVGVDPKRILVLTFTKKAADEMGARVEALGVSGARVGTIHSLCLQIIREDRTPWATWEIRESTRIELKEVLGHRHMNWVGSDPALVGKLISLAKASLEDPGSPEARVRAERLFGPKSAHQALEAYQRYEDLLEQREILTYDNMVVYAARHLEDEQNRITWAARYDHVVQDEAQDENKAQRFIFSSLARDHRNYMVVGDVFQGIFGWRGSSVEALAGFGAEWPGAATYWLPRNYRSGRSIVAAANGVILEHPALGEIEPQEMVAERASEGTVAARVAETLDGEASNFAAWVRDSMRSGLAQKHAQFCALFRTNAQSRALEEGLIGARIPYVVVGGVSFYERKEVRDLLGYLRIAAGRGEVEDVKRCINAPFRFLGAAFVERVVSEADRREARGDRFEWTELVRHVSDGARIQGRQRASADEWAVIVEELREMIEADPESPRSVVDARPSALLEHVVQRTRYLDWLRKEEGEETIETSQSSNVREMIRVAGRFATAVELLDYVDETIRAARRQRSDRQAGGDRVVLMNIHRSKGLEFDHVWVAGFNELVLPHPMAEDEREERRLAYVAMTRARDSLVLSYVRTMATRTGIRDTPPSRYLADAGVELDEPA